MSSDSFLDIISRRRTYYQLGADSPISDACLQKIIENVILNVPSAFNSQTVRIILLVREDHRKLWDIVKEVLKAVVPEDAFLATDSKLNGFQAAYGTVRPRKPHSSCALAYYRDLGSVLRPSSHHPQITGKLRLICR